MSVIQGFVFTTDTLKLTPNFVLSMHIDNRTNDRTKQEREI